MTVPGSSIELLHLEARKFPEVFKIKIMNNNEMMKSRENGKFQILPEGPPRMKKSRRVLRTIFFCAAARRQPQQVSQRTQERGQMSEIREFDNLAEIHLSFGTDTLDINFDH